MTKHKKKKKKKTPKKEKEKERTRADKREIDELDHLIRTDERHETENVDIRMISVRYGQRALFSILTTSLSCLKHTSTLCILDDCQRRVSAK
jgi:hypothetical protein